MAYFDFLAFPARQEPSGAVETPELSEEEKKKRRAPSLTGKGMEIDESIRQSVKGIKEQSGSLSIMPGARPGTPGTSSASVIRGELERIKTSGPDEEFFQKIYGAASRIDASDPIQRYDIEKVKSLAQNGLDRLREREKLVKIVPQVMSSVEKESVFREQAGLFAEREQKANIALERLKELEAGVGKYSREAEELKASIPGLLNEARRGREFAAQAQQFANAPVQETDDLYDSLKSLWKDQDIKLLYQRRSAIKSDSPFAVDPINGNGQMTPNAQPGVAVVRELKELPGGQAVIQKIASLKTQADAELKDKGNGFDYATASRSAKEAEATVANLRGLLEKPEMKFTESAWFLALTMIAAGVEAGVKIWSRNPNPGSGVQRYLQEIYRKQREEEALKERRSERERMLRAETVRQAFRERQHDERMQMEMLKLAERQASHVKGEDEIADKIFSQYRSRASRAGAVSQQLFMDFSLTEQQRDSLEEQKEQLLDESTSLYAQYLKRKSMAEEEKKKKAEEEKKTDAAGPPANR